MFCIVFGILQAGTNTTLLVVFLALGAAFLAVVLPPHPRARAGRSGNRCCPEMFRNRTANLGLVTQNLQWLLLMGISFVTAVYLQTEHHYSAIKTGVVFTAATLGILVSSLAAERFAHGASPCGR